MSDFKLVKLLDPVVQLNVNLHATGVYNAATTYGVGDSVSYGNSSYIAILPTTGNVPTNTTYWQLLASAATNKLTTTARNTSGATIPKGSVVYFNGANGNLPTLALSLANSEPTSSKTVGITTVSIADNANGEILILGLAESLDTSSFTVGLSLWLSPTVPGAMTNTKPSAPNHAVFIGTTTRSHPTDGTIEIRVQNGFELDELHNVSISSVADNQVLKYDAPNLLWKNETLVKADVGLSNVDNTSDANKAVSTATQTALNLKADLASPALTGTPTAPTQTALDNSTKIATTAYVYAATVAVTAPDATTTVKGIIKLAGDLAGTAALPTVPGLAGKEPTITATTSADYYRGDKTFQTLNKTAVGLSNVVNSDTTTTANITDSSNKRFVTDANLVTIAAQSGTNTGDQNALTVPNTPAGNIAATNVQAALNELDTEKEAVANKATNLTSPDNTKYPTTLAVSNAIGAIPLSNYVLKAGDTMTGLLEIVTTLATTDPSVFVRNLSPLGIGSFLAENDNNNILTIGVTGTTVTGLPTPNDEAFIYSSNAINAATTLAGGFKWNQDGTQVASIINGAFTANSIDASPVNINGLSQTTPTVSDFVPFTNGATNHKASLNEMPVSAPQNLNSIVNAIIFG